jgi:alpha-galactosidase
MQVATASLTMAVTASPDEMAQAKCWTTSQFEGKAVSPSLQPGLEIVTNHDPVQKNARFGKPLNLAGTSYTHGLFCHATSKIVVHLPSPGRTFEAVVGVDSNEQTHGHGSIVFDVELRGKKVFHSDVLREGMTGVPVKVDLDGATEFTLSVGDGGDGIACDHADWADANITLADGKTIRLADLPMAGGPAVVDPQTPPFSFVYGGKSSSELLKTWEVARTSQEIDSQRVQHTITYRDPATHLVLRCIGVEYRDFPTVEWTLYFKNAGQDETPILENIQALDMRFTRVGYGEYLLHNAVGSDCTIRDYEPLETPLPPKSQKRIGAARGRPTSSDWSYFNLETPTGEGVIAAVGWPGQWSSLWTRDDGVGLRLQAGQELTHFKLLPGEEVRSPLIVLQFYRGPWLRAQNIWRRWMMAHNLPRPNGKLPQPELFGCSSYLFDNMVQANEQNQIEFIRRYLEEKIPIGHWWMDAGWYVCDPVGWVKTGTWEVDSRRFPRGLRAISDYAHANNIKTLVWFEPERVASDTWIANNHPDWVLGGKNGGLLNLGNSDARRWLLEHFDALMKDQGIDLYRQDFNMDPLESWRNADTPDRQGITEIEHVTGYLAYWDGLLKRRPDLLIDSCASGGRRNDLESMRRAIPLWCTDYSCGGSEPIGAQCCSYGISLWLPLYGTGACNTDVYQLRSNMVPFTNLLFDVRDKKLDYNQIRRTISQWQELATCYLGDFYPLTRYNTGSDAWMAWQFNCPEEGKGAVQAFRRNECVFESGRLKLFDLAPDAEYEIVDLDVGQPRRLSGRELMTKGILVTIPDQPGAVVITYRKGS